MGQKTNPQILRLGKIKEWEIKYLEKKSTELTLYSFLTLEIEKFIYKFFEKQDLNVQNCKISFSETSLHIFIAYFSNPNLFSTFNKLNEQQKIKIKFKKSFPKNKTSILLKKHKNYNLYNKKIFDQNLSDEFNTILHKHLYFEQKYQRISDISLHKTQISLKSFKNLHHLKTNTLLKKIVKSVNNFTKKKINFFLTLEQVNNNINFSKELTSNEKKKLKSSLVELRKFQKNEFFKNGIALAYICVKNPNSSKLIANYIKFYLTKIKRPNFFLRFLKKILNLFIQKKFSKLKQIQIKIKGRINRVPRAKSKLIKIGNKGIPMLTINSNIDFYEETAFTSNGTLGVKVWTYKKL